MGRFVIGMVLALVAFGPLVWGARRLRRTLLPSWRGAPAALADAALLIATVVVVSQTLALAGLYRLGPVTVTFALIGAGWARWARRALPVVDDFAPAAPSVLGPAGNVLAALAVALVAGPWTARAVRGYVDGIVGADTLWYHLPGAARLVQTGAMQGIHHFDAGNLTAYYPNDSWFFHSVGMLYLESDVLSPVVNHGWVALALLAGWVLGRPFGVAPASLTGVAVIMGAPGFVGHEAGSAMNDVTGIALVLTAGALLVNATPERVTRSVPVIALAAATTGIALGTKWTMIPAAGALTLGVIVAAPRAARLATAVPWLVASGLTGLFTYVRNWILVGNPTPPLELSVGPITFERVTPENEGFKAVAEFIFDDQAWRTQLRPGLEVFFGSLWWLVPLVGAAALIAVVVFGRPRMVRLVGFVGLVALLGYLFQPQALLFLGTPAYFLSNLRYGTIGLVLGLAALPLVPALRRGRRVWLAPGVFAVALAAVQFDDGLWHGVDDWRFQDPIRGLHTRVGVATTLAVGMVGVVLAWAASRRRLPTVRFSPAFAGVVLVAVAVGLAGVESVYRDHRYADASYDDAYLDERDERVALQGINTQYLFYGDDLSNYVQWVGDTSDGTFRPITSCREWAETINAGRYTYALFGRAALDQPYDTYGWTKADPAAVAVRDFDDLTTTGGLADLARPAVFRLTGPLDPTRCDA